MNSPDVRTRQRGGPKLTAAERRNQRRNERYQNDPAYRDAVLARGRDSYRERASVEQREPVALSRLQFIGKVRDVVLDGQETKHRTFTADEVAEALGGFNPQVIRRWWSKGQLPAPALESQVIVQRKNDVKGRTRVNVYLQEEVAVIVRVLGEHLQSTAYYRADHTDVREALHAGIQSVRDHHGV